MSVSVCLCAYASVRPSLWKVRMASMAAAMPAAGRSGNSSFLERDALKNIVYRILWSKVGFEVYSRLSNLVAVDRVCDWLGGGTELSREEKDRLFVDMDAAYKKVVDYKQLERFSYKAFLPSGSGWTTNYYPKDYDYSLDGSWIDSEGAYGYSLSMHLNVLRSRSGVPYSESKRIDCPPNKGWVVGFIQWNLSLAPEGTYEYSWVGKSAGVEMVVGFVSHIDSKGMIVDPATLGEGTNVDIFSSKFDLIGYATFSPNECLGADFYRFSIKKGGEVEGVTLSHAPAIPWGNPVKGRAYKVPTYCELKVMSANAALKGLGSAKNVDELLESFESLAVNVEARKAPTLTVTDVVVVGRQLRQDRFENEWSVDVARAFGNVLKTVKRNNKQDDASAKRKNLEEGEHQKRKKRNS